jgi:hypothetical protein
MGIGVSVNTACGDHLEDNTLTVNKWTVGSEWLSIRKRRAARAIAFELSWLPNVSGCRKDPSEASSVTGHDFSRAANRTQKEAGL